MTRWLTLDVYFDFICPWCLIGKQHLDSALAQLRAEDPTLAIDVNWHGGQLLPQLPAEGVPFAEFYLHRLGSEQAVRERQRQVQQAAADAGITLDLSRITKMPNTAAAHRLFRQASLLGSTAQRDTLLARLFAAYFDYGEDLGDPATLLNIAQECGYYLSEAAVVPPGIAELFTGSANRHVPFGVPYFLINGSHSLSGAQPADLLAAACRRALSPTTTGDGANG